MKNSEKGKFENAWQAAFENAEYAPSEDVWTGVEQGLNKTETATMKRRVVFYQRLAAASILFALLLGGLSTYYILDFTKKQEMNLAQDNATIISEGNEAMDNGTTIASSGEASDKTKEQDNSGRVTNNGRLKDETNYHSTGYSNNALNQSDGNTIAQNEDLYNARGNTRQRVMNDYPSLLSMIPEPSTSLKGSMNEVTIVRKLPAMPASFMNSKKDQPSKENVWASLGASTGNYSPSSDFGSSVSSSKVLYQNSSGLNSAQSANSTSSSVGTAYSVGMNVGKRISNRWLVLGGVSYLNQAIGYTSNFATVDANNTVMASVADYSNYKSSSVIAVTSPYQINSVNEFISVPVQAGYLLVDRRVGLQLNSGVSTDFFMQNTLTDKSGQLASYSSGAGEESPYRTVSWAGLMGTEVSYKIATQYRISIAPGLRYSLNSVLKSDSSPSNPFMWDVGFRFRYIFK